MNILFNLLQAQPPKGFQDPGTLMFTIIMVGFIAFFYFFIVRPQNKKRKEMENMLNALKKGDKIVTIGGIHGKISNVRDTDIVVKVDANTELTFEKSAISRVVKATNTGKDEAELKK
ncbi:MAG: preprotein translocase subunit YajC [Spirochaetes bacterium]|nr:preprotein translocase subunit YajC [Spirochaetota bacterium]